MRHLIIYLVILCTSFCAWSQEKANIERILVDAVQDYENEDLDAARLKLQAIVSADSTNDAAYYYLGMCDYYSGDALSASRNVKKAASLDPDNEWYSKILEFFRIPSLLDEAEQSRLARDYASFFDKLAVFASDREVAVDPKCRYLTSTFGSFDSRIYNDWKPSIETLLDALIASDPMALQTHHLAMQVHMLYDDKQKVISECEKLVALSAGDTLTAVSYLSVIGDTYHELGSTKDAYRTYERILSIVPDYAPVLNNYAYFLSIEGKKLRKALKMSRETILQEPDNPTYLDTYGWILHLLGRDADAKPYFKHAMLYGGKESDVVLEHYSIVLESLGEKDLAAYYRNLSKAK